MSSTTAQVYLQLWLSEQIPIGEWKRILEERKDVKELYQKHLESKNGYRYIQKLFRLLRKQRFRCIA